MLLRAAPAGASGSVSPLCMESITEMQIKRWFVEAHLSITLPGHVFTAGGGNSVTDGECRRAAG